jgi:MGT family glycosyltransferase
MIPARLPFARRWPAPARAAAAIPDALARENIALCPLPFPLAMAFYGAQVPMHRGYDELRVAVKLFTSGLVPHARAIAAHAKTLRAQVIVGDYLMPAAMLGARLAAVPYAAIYHSALPFATEGAPPFGSGLRNDAPRDARWRDAERALESLSDLFDQRVREASRALGLPIPPAKMLTQPLSPSLNLVASTPELEPGLLPLDETVVMTGPCLPRVREADRADPALAAVSDRHRNVYVSLGTVFNGQPSVFEAILDGLAREDTRVIVSAGASYAKLRARESDSVRVFERVPQIALLSHVDVVITHGGNNTVQETLAAGKPMVVVPFGGDQLENARRVERLGVGVAVLPDELNPLAIREAIRRVSDESAIARARAIGRALDGVDGVGRAVSALRALVSRPR